MRRTLNDSEAGRVAQACFQHLIPRVPTGALRLQISHLRAQDRGAQIVHATRNIGRGVFQRGKGLDGRRGKVALKKHVAAGQHDRCRRQMRIIRDKESALARIHMFIGLARIASNGPMAPGRNTIPGGPHGVGAILDHNHSGCIANRHKTIHIRDVTAHMAEQKNTRPIRLGLKILKIDREAFGNANKDGHSPHRCDGAWNRRQCKCVA